jgi:N-hydroxyarylamine O-acetyltransferase
MPTICTGVCLPDSADLPDSANIDAYFARIGYAGSRDPTLETLANIHLHHPQVIPFETLDPLLKRPVLLSTAAIEEKLLFRGRGGWCFEHNLLLSRVLQAIGFRVTGLAARVLWNAPEDVVRARSHMLLRIDALDGGPYIADVGFGGLTLTGPLRLVADVEQTTPHEKFRLREADGTFILEARIRDVWKPLYSFDLQPQVLPDYEVWNWHLAHHPESPFVSNLMAARVTLDRRYGLFNNKLSIHPLHGESQQTTLTSAAELRGTLQHLFGIRLPDDPGLDDMLTHLVSTRT